MPKPAQTPPSPAHFEAALALLPRADLLALSRRCLDLAAGGVELVGITEGGRAMTAASVAAVSLYLSAAGFSALGRATKSHIGTASQWLELTRRVIRCEFIR